MKALSLWQPWASLMAVGAKKIETRSWSTDYRGLIAIHAAKKWDEDLKDQCLARPFYDRLFGDGHFKNSTKLPRGCFVAVGKLSHCLSTTDYLNFIPSVNTDEFWFGDYSPGRYMWVFDEIWQLREPVHARGYQALWTPEEELKEVISAMSPEEVETLNG
jgi:activating signal cointegrator 1